MKISEACTYTGAVAGLATATTGSFVIPVLCALSDSKMIGSCLSAGTGMVIVYISAGTVAGAGMGKITGVALEAIKDKIWGQEPSA